MNADSTCVTAVRNGGFLVLPTEIMLTQYSSSLRIQQKLSYTAKLISNVKLQR